MTWENVTLLTEEVKPCQSLSEETMTDWRPQRGRSIIRCDGATCCSSAGNTARGTAAENGTAAEQTDAILDKMDVILKGNGASLANVVKVTSFVTDLREGPEIGEVRRPPLCRRVPCQHPSTSGGLGHTRHQDRDRGHRCLGWLVLSPSVD